MNTKMIYLIIILIVLLAGSTIFSFYKQKEISNKNDAIIKALNAEKTERKKSEEAILDSLKLIDKTVYATRSLVIKLEKRDSILKREQERKDNFKNLKGKILENKIHEEFNKDTSIDNKH